MAGSTIVLLIIVGILVLVASWLAGAYNGLVRLRNHVKNAWAQIDVQLKRRWDLIPNLVETVKGYTKHEAETLQRVTEARNVAQSAAGKGVARQAEAERESRAILIKANAELQASSTLAEAAKNMKDPNAMQLRILSTVNDVSKDQSNK